MGRFVSGGAGGQPRRKIVTLFASNPAVPVPSWAQGGKGIVRVTGVGGGASGYVTVTANSTEGGGAGAFAVDHPIVIPAGVTTLDAAIGAGGAAITAAVVTYGNAGGTTSLTVGPNVLRLGGGGSGGNGSNANEPRYGGVPTFGLFGEYKGGSPVSIVGADSSGMPASGVSAGCATLGVGAYGGTSGTGTNGNGNGSFSQWGSPPILRTASAPANQSVAPSVGYGAGGAGAYWSSGGPVTSGAGAPGFLTLEFIEGT